MSEPMLDAVDEIFGNANRLVAAVGEDQWGADTPCTEWDARALVNHMTGTAHVFGGSATRTPPAAGPDDADHLGDNPVGSYAAAAQATQEAWRAEGALDGMTVVPAEMPAVAALGVNILDTGIHSWDLAQATGQDHGLTPELIAIIDEWSHQIISDEVRSGGGFGSVLEPASDNALTTMLAFVGREG